MQLYLDEKSVIITNNDLFVRKDALLCDLKKKISAGEIGQCAGKSLGRR